MVYAFIVDLEPEANVLTGQANESQELASPSTTHPLPILDGKRPQSPSTSIADQICDSTNSVQKRCKLNKERPSEGFYASFVPKLLAMMKREWKNRSWSSVLNTQPTEVSENLPSEPPYGSPISCYTPGQEDVLPIPEEWLRAVNYFTSATQKLMHQPSGISVGQLDCPDNGLELEGQMQQQSVIQPALSRLDAQPSTSYLNKNLGYLNSEFGSSRETSRRTRTIFSNRQLNSLEGVFRVNKFPNQATRSRLAQVLNLDEFRVKVSLQLINLTSFLCLHISLVKRGDGTFNGPSAGHMNGAAVKCLVGWASRLCFYALVVNCSGCSAALFIPKLCIHCNLGKMLQTECSSIGQLC